MTDERNPDYSKPIRFTSNRIGDGRTIAIYDPGKNNYEETYKAIWRAIRKKEIGEVRGLAYLATLKIARAKAEGREPDVDDLLDAIDTPNNIENSIPKSLEDIGLDDED